MARLPDDLRKNLTRRFQQSLVTVVGNTARPVQKMWAELDNHDTDAVDLLANRSAAILAASKTIAVRQSLGYYSTLTGVRHVTVKPGEINAEPTMRDPFISYWGGLKNGHTVAIALALGSSRIIDVVTNLVNTTARQTGGLLIAKADVKVGGWERITDSNACEWCEEVALDTYSSADSADFGHDRCGCTAAPVF